MSKTLKELNLEDDFLFAKVMSDKDVCIEVKNNKKIEVEFMTLLERDREKLEEGKLETIKAIMIEDLEELGDLNKGLELKINLENNLETLKSWRRLLKKAISVEEFEQLIN